MIEHHLEVNKLPLLHEVKAILHRFRDPLFHLRRSCRQQDPDALIVPSDRREFAQLCKLCQCPFLVKRLPHQISSWHGAIPIERLLNGPHWGIQSHEHNVPWLPVGLDKRDNLPPLLLLCSLVIVR